MQNYFYVQEAPNGSILEKSLFNSYFGFTRSEQLDLSNFPKKVGLEQAGIVSGLYINDQSCMNSKIYIQFLARLDGFIM